MQGTCVGHLTFTMARRVSVITHYSCTWMPSPSSSGTLPRSHWESAESQPAPSASVILSGPTASFILHDSCCPGGWWMACLGLLKPAQQTHTIHSSSPAMLYYLHSSCPLDILDTSSVHHMYNNMHARTCPLPALYLHHTCPAHICPLPALHLHPTPPS